MARSPLERRKGFLRRRDGDEAAKTDGLTGASIGKSAPLQCPLPSGQELALVPLVVRWKCLPSGGGWLEPLEAAMVATPRSWFTTTFAFCFEMREGILLFSAFQAFTAIFWLALSSSSFFMKDLYIGE